MVIVVVGSRQGRLVGPAMLLEVVVGEGCGFSIPGGSSGILEKRKSGRMMMSHAVRVLEINDGISLTARQIADGEFKLNLANQLLAKIVQTGLSGE